MSVTCVFGMQWGDEGKGRLVDLLAAESDVVVRYQGGANAGHTVIVRGERYVLQLLPSGVLHPRATIVVGNGVVLDPWSLFEEVDALAARGVSLEGRLLVSDRAHIVLPYAKSVDRAMESLRGGSALGTTSRGIGPTYGDKYMREGLRVADLLVPERCLERLRANLAARNAVLERAGITPLAASEVEAATIAIGRRLAPLVTDTTAYLLDAWRRGKRILLEGAQGFGLDVDHGSYPFVTSSSTGSAGATAGTGLPPRAIDRVLGVVKAYTTRVGAGPMPTRDEGDAGRHMQARGREVGSVTGRPRACGWFDAVLPRRAAATQGVDAVAVTKLDVLSGLEEVRICRAYELGGRRLDAPPAHAADWGACRPVYERYAGWEEDLSGVRRFEDLPRAARVYVHALQEALGVPVEMVSVGAEREQFMSTSRGVPVPV
jgi:adenylosuccinate synthase